MSAKTKLSAGLVATTIIASAGVARGVGQEALGQDGTPPAPPIREFTAAEPVIPNDGLERVVVTVGGSTGPTPADIDTDNESEGEWIDRVPPDATLATATTANSAMSTARVGFTI